MPGGAAVPRIAVLVPAHLHADRRAADQPARPRTGNEAQGTPSGRVSSSAGTAASSSGRVTVRPGRPSGGRPGPARMPAPPPARRTMSPSRPARSTGLAQPAAVASRWRPYAIHVEVNPGQPRVTGPPSSHPGSPSHPGSRVTGPPASRSRRRRSRAPGPGWRPGARGRGRIRHKACRRLRCRTGGRRTSRTR